MSKVPTKSEKLKYTKAAEEKKKRGKSKMIKYKNALKIKRMGPKIFAWEK
jgi:hypothetical protein